MSNLLGDVFSFGNTAKRKIKGLLDDPLGSLQQFVGNENDRAGRFNQLTDQAATEMQARIKSGGKMGPNQVKLAGLLADAYNPAGMVVWHGSPHKFSKFDSSKIGTGEGAQAYGHGLYLAESSDVAKMYQDKLTDPAFNAAGANAAKVRLNEKIAKRVEATDPERAAKLRAEVASLSDPAGALYKVDLPDEHIAKMLDWDKPLSQQAPEVKSALEGIVTKLPKGKQDETLRSIRGQLADYERDWAPVTGANLYRQLGQLNGAGVKTTVSGVQDSNPFAADLFRQAGIPGIRYLDGGSRGTGSGTSNFVVFPGNENLLTILERNGQPMGLLGQ
jgi:hypothetical protein